MKSYVRIDYKLTNQQINQWIWNSSKPCTWFKKKSERNFQQT